MADKKYAVEVRDVHKRFSYSRHKNNSLKRAITQVFKKKDTGKDSFYALDGISFNVEKGDFFGILGRNGSGKSTLLKIISEIYQPTSGSVKHDGKLVSFIELGVGFKPELTGKENVYLNGGLLGFSKKEVEAMYDDIVAFAELEDFMDQQLKNYSSGMKVRLAFSVAIRAKADILVLDEVLAVGDAAFQKKCNDYFRTLTDSEKTVILVTHSMIAVKEYCNKAILIEDGIISHFGSAEDVADEYTALFERKRSTVTTTQNHRGSSEAEFVGAKVVVEENFITIAFTVENKEREPKKDVHIFTDIRRDNRIITGFRTDISGGIALAAHEKKTIKLRLDNIFGNGDYTVTSTLRNGTDDNRVYDTWIDIATFENKFGKDTYYPVEVSVKKV